MISQKISQRLDSLPEIDSISERWVWELIQNAKDAGSEFGKIKIKLDIYDDRLIFSHNGSPFTFKNLNSLAFHYSAKEDENHNDLQTTGKYGTGFMVTYVISKKVRLNCKFREYPKIEDDSSDSEVE
jgi:HSP90 family molecular chaperone